MRLLGNFSEARQHHRARTKMREEEEWKTEVDNELYEEYSKLDTEETEYGLLV